MFKTLLVDDNPLFRDALRDILSRHFPFMRIEEAATGAAAMRHGGQQQLVLMDIRLPDASGLALTRRLKVSHPGSLVWVITQFDLPEYRDAASQSGASAFIIKDSMTESTVVALVESMLAARAKVLIIDDDLRFRTALGDLFDDCWPDTVVAEMAWPDLPAAAAWPRPDLVLLEPGPGDEGIGQMEAILAAHEAAHLVVVAGADWPEHQEWALRHGIRHFILKDVKDGRLFEELVAAIGAHLPAPGRPCGHVAV